MHTFFIFFKGREKPRRKQIELNGKVDERTVNYGNGKI